MDRKCYSKAVAIDEPIDQVVYLEVVGSTGNLVPLLMKITTPDEHLYGPLLLQ
jgi:hypothetical protein